MGWGDVLRIAPVLSVILSKLFLISGHVYPEAIFNVDVVAYIIGVVSLYLLLRYKFDYNLSLLGSIVYATFTLLYSWVAIGGNDIIGVSGTILTIYLILMSNKYSNKFYFIALPVAAYSFLSRYTSGVMIFSILFFLAINEIKLREIKHLIVGSILGVLSISWFLYQFNKALNTPFPFLGQFTGTVQNKAVMDSGYLPDNLYYIRNILKYLSSYVNINDFNAIIKPSLNTTSIFSYLLLILMIIGVISIIYKIYSSIKNNKRYFLTRKNKIILVILTIITFICIFTIGGSYIITILLFLIVLSGLYYLLDVYNIEKLDYEFLMISLFVVYLVFHSILSTKNDRYFITVLPFIAYFITCGLSFIYERIDNRLKKVSIKNYSIKVSNIITITLIIFLTVNSLVFAYSIPEKNHYKDIGDACGWLIDNDSSLSNQTIIVSDNWPAVTWYLNIYSRRGVLDVNNQSRVWLFSKFILSQNDTHNAATYYIDTNNELKQSYPGLTKIYDTGDVAIYKNTYLLNNDNSSLKSNNYDNYINSTLKHTKKDGKFYWL
jgi:hypothetical protein